MQIYFLEDKSDQVAVKQLLGPFTKMKKHLLFLPFLGMDLAFVNVKKVQRKHSSVTYGAENSAAIDGNRSSTVHSVSINIRIFLNL